MFPTTWIKKQLRAALNLPQLESQIRHFVKTSAPGTVYKCTLNGVELLLPVELLRLYPHCLRLRPDFAIALLCRLGFLPTSLSQKSHSQAIELGYAANSDRWREQKLTYFVETEQANWLCDKLNPGDTVLDIGAAFGAIAVTLSPTVGTTGRVYAFEPSRTAGKFLKQIVGLNDISNITLVESAISDRPGSADFIEYTTDNDLPWLSDVSTLKTESNLQHDLNHLCYEVKIATIDDYVAAMQIQPKAIKMDIEGFELYGLHGGQHTLEQYQPYLCIDIHQDVKTGQSSRLEVEPYLLSLGYECYLQGHALYASPKNRMR